MIKSISVFKRRPDLSVAEFGDYWKAVHAPLVCKLAGLRRYVQGPAHDSAYANGREPVFDGMAETWFDDLDALRALAGSEEYAAVRADEANFIDAASMTMLLCNEVTIVDGASAPLRFAALVHRRPDLSVAEFQRYWREVHGPLAAHNPYIRRYVQNHIRPGAYASGNAPPFDGVAVTWFDSFEDMRASASTPELAATRADEPNFLTFEHGPLPFLVATERVVMG